MPMAIAESYFSGCRKSNSVSAGSHIPTASRGQEWRQFAGGLYGRMIPEWKLSNAIIILAGVLKVYNATKPVRVHNAICSLLSSVTAYLARYSLSLYVTKIPSIFLRVADSSIFSHFLIPHFRVTVNRGNGLLRFVDECVSRQPTTRTMTINQIIRACLASTDRKK